MAREDCTYSSRAGVARLVWRYAIASLAAFSFAPHA